jgi:hypothetical protein
MFLASLLHLHGVQVLKHRTIPFYALSSIGGGGGNKFQFAQRDNPDAPIQHSLEVFF